MFVGRLGNRLIVAYENVEEAISKRACMACDNHGLAFICPFYAACRAELLSYEKPNVFKLRSRTEIEKEFNVSTEGIKVLWRMI